MIPDRLLPLVVMLVRPATATDRYGNTTLDYGDAAARTPIRAWTEQAGATEPLSDGRDPAVTAWLLITNHLGIAARDRIEHDGHLLEVDGVPASVYTPAGVHHLEARLKSVEG